MTLTLRAPSRGVAGGAALRLSVFGPDESGAGEARAVVRMQVVVRAAGSATRRQTLREWRGAGPMVARGGGVVLWASEAVEARAGGSGSDSRAGGRAEIAVPAWVPPTVSGAQLRVWATVWAASENADGRHREVAALPLALGSFGRGDEAWAKRW